MKIPNIDSKEIPIEYKKITSDDFDNKLFDVKISEVIKPDDEGYIGERLFPILEGDLHNSNTTVINAGVGQGKTTSIIKVITKYANNPDYVVVIAVPYKSLIEQYCKDFSKYLSEDSILNLLDYEETFRNSRKDSEKSKWGYIDDELMLPISTKLNSVAVHVMTVNALLGNPGDSNVFNSSFRRDYFQHLNNYCASTNKKLILLFDEIHDSIHNFKEQYIFNLWNFQGLIHKAYIVSATFNEASKEVIKYLSELTEKKILIVESLRLPKPDRQSDLYLNFYVHNQIDRDANLVELVSRLVRSNSSFDILVYSKTLAEKLINQKKASSSKVKKVSDILEEHTHIVNECFSNPYNPRKTKKFKVDSNIINIGTNFSTGVNIEDENHTFIILIPKDISNEYLDNKGVFTNGVNVITQALARQRKKGDIYLFLPNPEGIKQDSLPYSDRLNKEMYEYFEYYRKSGSKKVSYSSINKDKELLSQAYEKLDLGISKAKVNLDAANRQGLNRLLYPTKEIFILNQGEKYLTKQFFGGDLSAYVLWAGISNQFLNCRLKSINSTDKLKFNKGKLFDEVKEFIYDYSNIEIINSLFKEFKLFDSFSGYEKLVLIQEIMIKYKIYVDNKKLITYELDKIYLMMLSVILGNTREFDLSNVKSNLQSLYIRSCVYHSNKLPMVNNEIKIRDFKIVTIFKKWHQIIEFIDNSKVEFKKGYKIPTKASVEFESFFYETDFDKDLKYLLSYETLLSTDILKFRNTITRAINENTLVNTFYKESIRLFYNSERRDTTKNKEKTAYYLIEKIDLTNITNFLHKPLPEKIL